MNDETKPSARGYRAPIGLSLLTACSLLNRHPPKIMKLDPTWPAELDADLQAGVEQANREFADAGWDIRIRWAGARGSTYQVERAPDGRPLRQSVQIIYVYDYPSRGTCYLSPGSGTNEGVVRLARENLSGGKYGPPHIIGNPPIWKKGGNPIGDTEVLCSATDEVAAGVHVAGR